MPDREPTTTPLPKSLATVAYLKARFDEHSDQLDIFMPLLLDALAQGSETIVTVASAQELIARQHGVAMPRDTVATLLNRARKSNAVSRESGAYRVDRSRLPQLDVRGAQARFSVEIAALAADFQAHAATRGLVLGDANEALAVLMTFLDEHQVGLLLGSDPPALSTVISTEHAKLLAAKFIADAVEANSRSAATIQQLVEGVVVYRAAFLPDLASRRKHFDGLRLYLDSGFVLQAIGYEGDAARVLARETIDVVRATGASCFVFDKTLFEIDRILNVFEHKIGSEMGRRELRPTPITRHFLTSHYSPGDIRQMRALLRSEVAEAGISTVGLPRRDPHHMLFDETKLAGAIADAVTQDESEPRVIHDVDCIVAITMLRAGHRAMHLEDARSVFVTTSTLLTRNASRCYREVEEIGVPPIVHVRAITNAAWLKRPRLSKDLKTHELVALCRAALRPSREVWARFLAHLNRLISEGKLTSEEQAFIVASEMADVYLSEAELDDIAEAGPDANTLDEVVARVKAKYTAQIREELEAETRKHAAADRRNTEEAIRIAEDLRRETETARLDVVSATEALRRIELRIDSRARAVASWICLTLRILGYLVIVVGFGAVLLSHHFAFGWLGIVIFLAVATFLVLELIGVLGHFQRFIRALEARLTAWFRELLH